MALAHQGRIRVRPGEIEKMLALHDKYDVSATSGSLRLRHAQHVGGEWPRWGWPRTGCEGLRGHGSLALGSPTPTPGSLGASWLFAGPCQAYWATEG
jgi:hypothetical protein